MLGFLSMLNPKMIFGAVKVVCIIVVAYLAIDTVRDFMAEQKRLTDGAIAANTARVSAEARAQEQANANVLLADALDVLKESSRLSAETVKQLNGEFREFRAQRQSEEAVFDSHDFDALTQAKPKTLERLSNAATARQFRNMEEVLDGT